MQSSHELEGIRDIHSVWASLQVHIPHNVEDIGQHAFTTGYITIIHQLKSITNNRLNLTAFSKILYSLTIILD